MKIFLKPAILSCIPLFLFTSSAAAFKAGDIIVRAGVASVSPSASSSNLNINGVDLPDTGVDVDTNTQLGLLATYMLTNELGISVLGSTPFKHEIKGENIGINDVGSAKQLPPTVTLDYYPLKHSNAWQPYIGFGFNYTIFYSESTSSELDNALGDTSLDLKNSFGLALKAGLDYKINDHFGINANIFWIDLDTEATIESNAGRVKVDVDVDPFVYMLTASYKF